MKKAGILLYIFFAYLLSITAFAQKLKPGFDKNEFRTLLLISTRTTADVNYYKEFPEPAPFKMLYQSSIVGLDNLWDLWESPDGIAVISIRGTTKEPLSWLSNFYAAMVPAKGSIQIEKDEIFNYHLAANPQAAVHVGWLLSMAYLSKDIVPKIKELNQRGIKNIILTGHSQGGAITYLLTAYLYNLQKIGELSADIRFKTYCSAGPKPGNLYFAYEYETMTQNGWAYNVVNAADWVPEMPLSIQTFADFNTTNPFQHAQKIIKAAKFPTNIALKYAWNQMSKPPQKATDNFQKYLGGATSKAIHKKINGFSAPEYFASNNYVRTGHQIILTPDDDYFKQFPNSDSAFFMHHFHKPYLYLLDKLPTNVALDQIAALTYTPTDEDIKAAKDRTKPLKPKRIFAHTLIGGQLPDFTLLNQNLRQAGFMKLVSVFLSRGGGLYTIFQQIKLATLFNYKTYTSTKTKSNQENALRGTSIGTTLGVSLLNKGNTHIIPYGGIVYSWWGARISQDTANTQTYDKYLSGEPN